MINCNECIHQGVCETKDPKGCLNALGTCDNCKFAGRCVGITIVDEHLTTCHHGDGFFCILWEENL